jgi:histidyl-tRNA synthetase
LKLYPDFGTSLPKPVLVVIIFFRVFRTVARAFHFSEYDAPVLEPLDLYVKNQVRKLSVNFLILRTKVSEELPYAQN